MNIFLNVVYSYVYTKRLPSCYVLLGKYLSLKEDYFMNNMKDLIDKIVNEKAKGNSFQALNVQFKLMMKGIPVKEIDQNSPLNPEMLERIRSAAKDFSVQL